MPVANQPLSQSEKLAQALRAMGHYFELDPKKVDFYIRQLELTGSKNKG